LALEACIKLYEVAVVEPAGGEDERGVALLRGRGEETAEHAFPVVVRHPHDPVGVAVGHPGDDRAEGEQREQVGGGEADRERDHPRARGHPHGGGDPDGRGRREPAHDVAPGEDDACAEEADPRDDLGRDPGGVEHDLIAEHGGEAERGHERECRGAGAHEHVGAEPGGLLAELALQPDEGAEHEGEEEQLQLGAGACCPPGHAALPFDPPSVVLCCRRSGCEGADVFRGGRRNDPASKLVNEVTHELRWRNTPLARSLVELRTPRGVEPQRARLCLFSCTAGSARTRGSKMGTGLAFFAEQAAPSNEVHGRGYSLDSAWRTWVASARKASPRWEISFFFSALISAVETL